jgi:hypothetical protein
MALSDEILADLAKKKGGPPKGGPPMKGMKPGNAAEDAADSGADDAQETDSYGSDEETAAGDVLDAMKGDDPAALATALRGFLDVCVPKIVDGMKG